jgi:hypothetical protein
MRSSRRSGYHDAATQAIDAETFAAQRSIPGGAGGAPPPTGRDPKDGIGLTRPPERQPARGLIPEGDPG